MQERPRGGLLRCFAPFSPPPPPSRRAGGGFLRGFDAGCAVFTSLACKSKPEVDFLALDAVADSIVHEWATQKVELISILY
jgi:hypothetical protein